MASVRHFAHKLSKTGFLVWKHILYALRSSFFLFTIHPLSKFNSTDIYVKNNKISATYLWRLHDECAAYCNEQNKMAFKRIRSAMDKKSKRDDTFYVL